ncbi:MAG: hypothetical protein HOM03_07705 [Marinovum sp.]|nr:hypothetical protein [Marinovum sp.]
MNKPVSTFDLVSSIIALGTGAMHAITLYHTYFIECDRAQESPCAVGSIDRTKQSGRHGE